MIQWNIDKPQGDIIVVKIAERFYNRKDCYEVLRFASGHYPHYSDTCGEEVPFSAIEKWCLIK